eukprot:2400078-Prymnesium_polylepis.2
MPSAIRALAPPLTDADQKVVESIRKLVLFFLGTAEPRGTPRSLRPGRALLPPLTFGRPEACAPASPLLCLLIVSPTRSL